MKKRFIPIIAIASILTLGSVATVVTSCGETTQKDVEVSAIELSLDKTTLTVGETATATVKITPTDATNKEYTLSSSDSSVASVSEDKVTALKAGSCKISATSKNGKTSTVSITVKASEVEVTGIELTLDKTTLTVGESTTATVKINPADATDKSYTISSSDTSVASVSGDKVTALKAGSCKITATSKNGKKSEVSLTVKEAEMADPKFVYDGAKEFTVNAGEDLTLPEVKALSGDGKTDISDLIELEDLNDNKSLNSSLTKFNSKIAGEHVLSYYVEEGTGEDVKSATLDIKVTVKAATENTFEISDEEADLGSIKEYKSFKDGFEKGKDSYIYKALGDANNATELCATSDAVMGNSLIIDFNKTAGSAMNSVFISLNDSLIRSEKVNYIVEFDYKIIDGTNFGNVYFGARWDGTDGINVQFANGKEASDGVIHYSHKFTEVEYPTDGNCGFFFFKLSADSNQGCKIAIDNIVIKASKITTYTEVKPTSDQLLADGGFTFNWKDKGSKFDQGETISVEDATLDSEYINEMKTTYKDYFGTNVMHLTGRDDHKFYGLDTTNLVVGKVVTVKYRFYGASFDASKFNMIIMSSSGNHTENDGVKFSQVGTSKFYDFEYTCKIASGDYQLNWYPQDSSFDIYVGNMNVTLKDAEETGGDTTERGNKVGAKWTQTSRAFGSGLVNNGCQVTNDFATPSSVAGDGIKEKITKLAYTSDAKNITVEWYNSSGKQIENGNEYKINVVYYVESYQSGSRFMLNFDNNVFLELDPSAGYHNFELNWTATKNVDFFSFYTPESAADAVVYVASTTVELTKINK